MAAAIFPLDTSKPWTFNNVTYEYDATEDRWFVVSTNAVDTIVEEIGENSTSIEGLQGQIDTEIENRTQLLNAGAAKNNQQDAAIDELSGRVDAIGASVGILEFKGRYRYKLEKSQAACDAALVELINQGMDQVEALRLHSDCVTAIGDPLDQGTFTSISTKDQSAVEELVISTFTLDGNVFDWENLLEIGDYIEIVEANLNDSVLYQVVTDPTRIAQEERIRVKYIKETGDGDGDFNINEVVEIRVIKQSIGLDVVEADKRYIQKPYVVYFEDTPADITPVHEGGLRNGELWFDTSSLELFVWNNNAWVGASPPASQDIVVRDVINTVDNLTEQQYNTSLALSNLASDLIAENNIYYSDDAPTGDATGTLRNGDLWIDSDDLTIKFYSGGAWINPDRQVGGDYLEKEGGDVTGELTFTKDRCNDVGCGPIHISPGNSTTAWSIRQDSADYLNFDANVGTYSEVIWFAPDGGATFSGQIELKQTATDDSHAVHKKYVDDRIAELESRITALGG